MERSAGFTFLEILCVVFVIGLISTLAVINIDRTPGDLALSEARRFKELVNHAANESITQGQVIGLSVDPSQNSYRFVKFDGGWSSFTNDEILREREVPSLVAIVVENVDSASDNDSGLFPAGEDLANNTSGNDDAKQIPDIVFEPGGRMPDFSVVFRAGEQVYEVAPEMGFRAVVLDYGDEKS